MKPEWTMDGLCYVCVGCGIAVTLDYEALGGMVKRRLKKRGMSSVSVREVPLDQYEQGIGDWVGDTSGEACPSPEPES
jgi:hypothetical protein